MGDLGASGDVIAIKSSSGEGSSTPTILSNRRCGVIVAVLDIPALVDGCVKIAISICNGTSSEVARNEEPLLSEGARDNPLGSEVGGIEFSTSTLIIVHPKEGTIVGGGRIFDATEDNISECGSIGI